MAAGVIFPISDRLADKTAKVLKNMHDPSLQITDYSEHLLEVLLEMADAGLHYYFEEMAERLGVGKFVMSAVHVGVKAMRKPMHMVLTKMIRSLGEEQLKKEAAFVREMFLQLDYDWKEKASA